MRAPLPHQLSYRADIDGLRAFAVLSVVLFHAHPDQLPGGFVGVDIFFVISGFLISSLLLDSARQQTFSFVDFYSRRIRRILPSLFIVLTSVFVAGWFILWPREFLDLNKTILSGVFFVPNFRMYAEAGYFAPNANLLPLLHTWSLGVEEQFYLVWPAVILIFWKKGLPWVIALLGTVSFVACVLFYSRHTNAVFYFPVTRLWELLAGGFLAWRERRHLHSHLGVTWDLPRWLREPISIFGAALLASAVFFTDASGPFPGWWALPPVLGTMLIIGAGPQTSFNRIILADPLVVRIGLISYPLYLWHWPILAFLRIYAGGSPTEIAKNVGLLAAIALSWLTYRFVEKPIRSQKVGFKNRDVVLALLGYGFILTIVSVTVIAMAGLPERYPPSLRQFLTFDYTNAGNKLWRDGTCFLEPGQTAQDWKQSCIDSKTLAHEPLIVIWGDSHAAYLLPGFKELQKSRRFRIGEMTSSRCAPFLGIASFPERPFCPSENEFFLRQIVETKPDLIILSADWYRVGYSGLDATLAALKSAHQKVTVLGPPPYWADDLPDLLVHLAFQDKNRMPHTLGPDWYRLFPESELHRFVESRGVPYISETSALCANTRCITMTGNKPQDIVVFDTDHLSNAGSAFLVQRIAKQALAGTDVAEH